MVLDTSYKGLFKVALPVMLGAFVQFLVMFVDTALLGRVSSDLHESSVIQAAAGQAGLLYTTFFMIFQGLSIGAQIQIASYLGLDKLKGIGKVFYNTQFLMLIGGIFVFLLFQFVSPIVINNVVHSENTATYINEFLSIRSIGYLFSSLFAGFTAYYIGTANTKVLFPAMFIISGLNIVLDLILIHGYFGVSPLGLKGAAIGSVVAEFFGLSFMGVYFYVKDRKLNFFDKIRISLKEIKDIIKLSVPLMFQSGLSLGVWSIFFLFIEKMGETEHTASILVRNFYYLTVIPEMGFNATAKTYVSSFLAQNKVKESISVLNRLALLSGLVSLVIVHGFWLYPEKLVSLLSDDLNVVVMTIPSLKLVAISMVMLSITFVYFAFVASSKKTVASLRIELVAVILYIIIGYFVTQSNLSLELVWLTDYSYFITIGVLTFLFIRKYKKNLNGITK